jgi:hypothetical protein
MDNATLSLLAADPAAFRKALLIDADGAAVPFKPDEWQRRDFEAMDAGWMFIAGRYKPPQRSKLGKAWDTLTGKQCPILRAWQERPRGHSKSADLAVMCAYALLFATRPIRGIAAAGDKDQAAIMLESVATLIRVNPWMNELLEVQSQSIINKKTGATLERISSDVGTSWGKLVDFIAADEVGHWPEAKGEALWSSLFSTAAKRSCVLCVISNAGFCESWQWKVREAVRTDSSWYFSHLEGPQASWIPQHRLEEQRRVLPASVYSRLFENLWSSGSGDALDSTVIEAAVCEKSGMTGKEQGWRWWCGIDIGVSRDFSSLVVVGRHYQTQRYRVALVRRWRPPPGGKINLEEVQQAIIEIHDNFHPHFYGDPYEMQLMAQQLQRYGVYVELVAFTGTALSEMASSLIEAFRDFRVTMHRDEALLGDLRRLRLKESPSGWRLDSPRTSSTGHSDSATALSLALLGMRRSGGGCGAPSAPDPAMLQQIEAGREQERKHHADWERRYLRSLHRRGGLGDRWRRAMSGENNCDGGSDGFCAPGSEPESDWQHRGNL